MHEGHAADEEAKLAYPTMRQAALSQARYRGLEKSGLKPEADVRRVVWWRVRGLWRAGQLLPLLGVLGLDALAIETAWEAPGRTPVWAVVALPVLTLLWLGVAARGCLRAWRMARTARQTPNTRMRYLLLHSYTSDAPWLVLFPDAAHSEKPETDPPVGALPLSYGPLRDRFRGLPTPTGTAELSGCLEPGSVVIPWVQNQPLWPTHGYRPIDLNDQQHFRSMNNLVRPE
ncbi:hypothetical protein [Streptomyces sp. PU-14G]|uniref:hypothetical protein n=1 Tax=Streptomyces sp. PU-14G TaxID=2800808 RepID=UPI0034DFFAFE